MSIQQLPLLEAAERLAHLAYHLARHGGPAIDVAQDLMRTSNQVSSRDGFRFFFYSNEGNEPVHIHVEKGQGYAKYWMLPSVRMNYAEGFTRREIRRMTELVEENSKLILQRWEEYFGD